MLSRRDVLLGTVLVGRAALARTVSASAPAPQPSTPVAFDVPPGACDCHTHIFGDLRRFPMIASRAYTPEPASIEEMRALHRALRVDRVVIVQPSVYGTDNACTLDAIEQLGSRARGVAVIDDKTPDAALETMHRGGIRGIRVNLETGGTADPAVARQRFQAAVQRVRARGWHVQIYARLSIIEAIHDEIVTAGVPVVIDHFGGAAARLGVSQPGFDVLLNLVRTGRAHVKVSAAYRSSSEAPDYPDVKPLAQALIAANPERVVWGTDWPHPDSSQVPGRKPSDVAPLLRIDDGRVFNQLASWAPDPAHRKLILAENPARLYGF
jgi:predicted TIM-barrel fold metal-dependent hydrolase